MYLNTMGAAITAQRDLASAYVRSGRSSELGIYLLVHSRGSVAFFERIEPPEDVRELHACFLEWQRSGVDALLAELQGHNARIKESSRRYGEAGRTLVESFKAFADSAGP